MNALHTSCIGQTKGSRVSASLHSILLSAVPKVLAVTRSTRAKDIQAAVQQFYKQMIGYQGAHKACDGCVPRARLLWHALAGFDRPLVRTLKFRYHCGEHGREELKNSDQMSEDSTKKT